MFAAIPRRLTYSLQKSPLKSNLFNYKNNFSKIFTKQIRHHQHGNAGHSIAKLQLPTVKNIICVASGKGGVGKSTIATNLALALSAHCQKKVGIIDADIYGPSIHRMMNVSGKPNVTIEQKIVPKSNYGVQVMSMGLLAEEDAPVIWRGPMVLFIKALISV